MDPYGEDVLYAPGPQSRSHCRVAVNVSALAALTIIKYKLNMAPAWTKLLSIVGRLLLFE